MYKKIKLYLADRLVPFTEVSGNRPILFNSEHQTTKEEYVNMVNTLKSTFDMFEVKISDYQYKRDDLIYATVNINSDKYPKLTYNYCIVEIDDEIVCYYINKINIIQNNVNRLFLKMDVFSTYFWQIDIANNFLVDRFNYVFNKEENRKYFLQTNKVEDDSIGSIVKSTKIVTKPLNKDMVTYAYRKFTSNQIERLKYLKHNYNDGYITEYDYTSYNIENTSNIYHIFKGPKMNKVYYMMNFDGLNNLVNEPVKILEYNTDIINNHNKISDKFIIIKNGEIFIVQKDEYVQLYYNASKISYNLNIRIVIDIDNIDASSITPTKVLEPDDPSIQPNPIPENWHRFTILNFDDNTIISDIYNVTKMFEHYNNANDINPKLYIGNWKQKGIRNIDLVINYKPISLYNINYTHLENIPMIDKLLEVNLVSWGLNKYSIKYNMLYYDNLRFRIINKVSSSGVYDYIFFIDGNAINNNNYYESQPIINYISLEHRFDNKAEYLASHNNQIQTQRKTLYDNRALGITKAIIGVQTSLGGAIAGTLSGRYDKTSQGLGNAMNSVVDIAGAAINYKNAIRKIDSKIEDVGNTRSGYNDGLQNSSVIDANHNNLFIEYNLPSSYMLNTILFHYHKYGYKFLSITNIKDIVKSTYDNKFVYIKVKEWNNAYLSSEIPYEAQILIEDLMLSGVHFWKDLSMTKYKINPPQFKLKVPNDMTIYNNERLY